MSSRDPRDVIIRPIVSEKSYAAYDANVGGRHTIVDRVWRLWQTHHPVAVPPVAILDDALPPFRMTVRQTLSVTALGYDYAAGTTSAAVSG